MKLAARLIASACIAHILVYLYAAPEHVLDATWPLHARFHVLQAIFWVVGFDAVLVPIALGPLQRRERWALWALVVAFPFVQGGYFIAMAMLPAGAPPELSAHIVMLVLSLLYLSGLVLASRDLPGAE